MALKRVYETLEEIPEELRALYNESDGKWTLDVEAGEGERSAADVTRALRARDNEKAEREKLKQQLDDLQSKLEGIDPDRLPDAADALKRLEELEHDQLINEKKYEEAAAVKFQRQIAELQRSVEAAERAAADAQGKQVQQRSRLESMMIEGALQAEFLKHQTDPAKLRYLLLDAKSKWELDTETDQPVPIDFIEDGKTKVTAMGPDGNPLTMEGHVKQLLADNPWAVLPSTGSSASHQTTGTNGAFSMTETEAQDFGRYKNMKDQATKAGVELDIVPG